MNILTTCMTPRMIETLMLNVHVICKFWVTTCIFLCLIKASFDDDPFDVNVDVDSIRVGDCEGKNLLI
jgi:hypothetical protein